MKKVNKKGFTLIELMIVLAIIAILAVVLIPKAGLLKDNAKAAGVTTNVNSVRAFLETKVADSGNYGTAGVAKIQTALKASFKDTNSVANPFTKLEAVATETASATSVGNTTDSIDVYGPATVVDNTTTTLTAVKTLTSTANKGIVYVYVCTDGYVVFGFDAQGAVVGAQAIN